MYMLVVLCIDRLVCRCLPALNEKSCCKQAQQRSLSATVICLIAVAKQQAVNDDHFLTNATYDCRQQLHAHILDARHSRTLQLLVRGCYHKQFTASRDKVACLPAISCIQ